MDYDPLDYPQLIQDALRDVVRRSFEIVAREGLPGDHHFYVTFRTDAEGVEMAQSLRALHPEEMTIVIQHQYVDLEVTGDTFSIGLFFGGVAHYLRVPFAAVRVFVDPSVGLQLAFSPPGEDDVAEESPEPEPATPSAEGAANVVSFEAFRKK